MTSGNATYDQVGGGINMSGGSGYVTNCHISGNVSYSYGGGTAYGAIYNCIFIGNSALGGGGGGSYQGTLNSCIMSNNVTFGHCYGGGSYESTLNNCTLVNNHADYGGGSYRGTLNNCLLSGNRADNYAGGAYFGILNDCRLSGNHSDWGGASMAATLTRCVLSGNSASRFGGGSSDGDILYNCLLTGNHAGQYGGGSAGGELNNCTLYGNTAGSYSGGSRGGELNNCIIWSNTVNGATANWKYSTLSDCCTTPLAPGSGNITNNPQFVDMANGDYRLDNSSPCIDLGNDANAPMPYDLDGTNRIIGSAVDMGAYECGYVAYSLSLSPTNKSYNSGAVSGQIIAVTGNVSWIATESLSWVSITAGSSGSGDGTVTYSLLANNSESTRNGILTVSGGGITQTVSIVQSSGWYPSASIQITDRTPAFSWFETSDATWYQIWINSNGKKYLSKWVNNSTTWTPPSDMNAGDYSWWIRAWGPAIGMQAWSDEQQFTIPANPPDKPILLTPTGAQFDRTPLFDWDSNEQATWYQLWISKDGKKYYSKWLNQTSTEWTPFWNLPNGEFEWWLRGWNVDGMGAWSTGTTFDYGRVILFSPAADSTVGTIGSFEWLDAPSGAAEWYQVWLGKNGSKYSNQWYRRSEVLDGSSLILDYELSVGTYNWWVRNWSAADGMGLWAGQEFTVE